MTHHTLLRTIIAHPNGGNLYGSPYLFRDASYNFTAAYSAGNLARDGWRMVGLDDVPAHLLQDARELTPGEYVDDRDAADYVDPAPTLADAVDRWSDAVTGAAEPWNDADGMERISLAADAVSAAQHATRRQTREHPPVNGCTRTGPHPCILTTGQPIPTVIPYGPPAPYTGSCGAHPTAVRLDQYGHCPACRESGL